jgi:very-short-patch-repair endonuclease
VGRERTLRPDIGGKRCVRGSGADAAIAELADRQHGVVARWQLRELGLGRHAIDGRIAAKRLHVVYRGAYAVGRRYIDQRGVWMAAVLSCGPDALLSHRPAAALLGIRPASSGWVDVTVPRRLRPRDGIRPHTATVPEDERAIHAGIPVTTVTRTLLDLATQLQPHELKRAAEQAEALQLTSPLSLVAVVQRHAGRRGAGALAAALGPLRQGLTRSELERRFVAFVDRVDLPPPRLNEWLDIGGELIQADCFWPEARLIAELDSRAWHDTEAAFERDRRRDRRCVAAGWAVIRVTYEALTSEQRELEHQLRALLTAAPAPPS